MQRTRAALVATFLALLVATGCATANPAPDVAEIGYTGGPVQGVHFREVFQPGSGLHWMGIFDGSYQYPVTVRTYIVSRAEGEGDRAKVDHINATTKDGVAVSWELAFTFKLNVSRLRAFHEGVGLSRSAWFEGGKPTTGWDTMLNDFFRQPLEGAVQEISRGLTADQIAKDPNTFRTANEGLGNQLKDRINRTAGGNYFCGPGFAGPVAADDQAQACPNMEVTIKSATLPGAVVQSYERQKVAENEKVEAQNRKAAADEIKGLYSDPNYVEYLNAQARLECAKRPDCSQVNVSGAGTGVNVNTGGR